MAKKIGPNVLCRVVGGNQGPKSPNVGRQVLVVNGYPGKEPHSLWGPIWSCRSLDGRPFLIKRDHEAATETGTVADFAEDWLEPVEDDPDAPKVQEKEHHLVD